MRNARRPPRGGGLSPLTSEPPALAGGSVGGNGRGAGGVREANKPRDDEAGRSPEPLRRRSLFDGPSWKLLRLTTDLVLLGAAMLAARAGARAAGVELEGHVLVFLFPPLVLLLFALAGLYKQRIEAGALDSVAQIMGATSLAGISIIAFADLLPSSPAVTPSIVRVWLFATVYLAGGRILLTWAQRRAYEGGLGKRTLIVGAGEVGGQVERRLREHPRFGLRPIGYLDAQPPPADMVPHRRAPVLGPPSRLAAIAEQTGAQHVVLGFTASRDHSLLPLLRECEERGLEVSLVPRLFESVNRRVQFEHIGGLPLLGLRTIDPKSWQFDLKHAADRVGAAVLLLLLGPLMLAIAAAVRLGSPGPALFRQRRIGRDGRAFEMLKFRSMRMATRDEPAGTQAAPPFETAPGGVEGEDRRTRLGAWLRRTSLDELPQLINVLRGEMSLVGPRPERPEFVELLGGAVHRYDDRHRVRSGITGLSQVQGLRGQTSIADRTELDNYYIRNWSPWLDVKILLITVTVLFRRAE